MRRHKLRKYIGCLIGAAIGDALATPHTGLTPDQTAASRTAGEFLPARTAMSYLIPVAELGFSEIGERLAAGQWTEDIQLMLALAEALIEEGGVFIPDAWSHSLVRWLNDEPRTFGASTIQAAMQLRTGGVFWDESGDPEGAGAGPAARTAPVALLFPDDAKERRRTAMTQAQVTHEHPDAQAAAVAVTEAIAIVLPFSDAELAEWNGAIFLTEIHSRVMECSPLFEEFARCLLLARSLLTDGVDLPTAVRVLGTTGWSREAVPTALYCIAHSPQNFESLMREVVVNTTESTEVICCIVGAVMGALHGIDAVPPRWREGVERATEIEEMAVKLLGLSAPEMAGPGFSS